MSHPLKLNPAEWPQIDQQRWREARSLTSFLSGPQPACHWSARRCLIVEQAYGQWLAFLAHTGELDPQTSPELRATHERIEAFVIGLQQRVAPWSVVMMLQGVHRMLAVMAPEYDCRWLTAVVTNLKRFAKSTRDRRGHMVSPRQLYCLGLDLMDQATQNLGQGLYCTATRSRDGLMIALLACCPLRIANLNAIIIGTHLLLDGDRYRLMFSEDETKTGQAYEGELPPELTPYVDAYLGVHRPSLLARGDDETSKRLWIDRWGGEMREPAIRTQIEKRTRDAFGRHVWPHLFRTIAATGFVDHAPSEVGLVPDLLGHASAHTAQKYYILSTGALAHDAVQSAFVLRRQAAVKRLREARRSSDG